MKKVLIATTALVVTAGAAAADIANVAMSGYARWGVLYDESNTTNETRIEHRFRLNIDVEAVADNGLELEARVRVQSDDNANGTSNVAGFNGPRFTIKSGAFRLDVGNTGGAIDSMPNYYGFEPGLTNFIGQYEGNSFGFDGYSSGGAGGQTIVASYSANGFGIIASYSDDSVADEEAAISVSYAFGDWTVALGFADSDVNNELVVLTVGGAIGNVKVAGLVGDDGSDTFYGLSGSIGVGAATDIVVAYGDSDAPGFDARFGLGFVHDLGGGVTLRGGIGDDGGVNKADFGIRFNF